MTTRVLQDHQRYQVRQSFQTLTLIKNRPQLEINTEKSFNTSQINLSQRAQTPEFIPKKGPTMNDLHYYYATP